MTIENRWSIDELLARYELEPDLLDVFLEGSFDCEIMTQAYAKAQMSRPTFYEIGAVNVPRELLDKYGLSSGNKQRIIALAKELGGLPDVARVICLADRDLDHWLGPLDVTRRLKWTMYCSIESHFLTADMVADILVTAARTRIIKIDLFIESLAVILKNLFALRLADKQLGLSLTWVALKKYLKKRGDAIEFEVDKYLVALLNGNAKLSQRNKFTSSYHAWLIKLDGDVRLSARGHDFTELLAWAVSEFGGQKEFSTQAAIERLLVLLARSAATITAELN